MVTRRKRIGVLIGSAIASYMRKIINGMYQAANDLGIDIVVFAGTQLAYNFLDGGEIDNDHDFMNRMLREHARRNELDGMVICYGSYSVFMDGDAKKRLLEMYSDTPYMLIGEFTDKTGTGYMINDNYYSMRKIVEHMVVYHGYTDILYMGGQPDNREAAERERAFRDVLIENDIPIRNEMMANGSFRETCDDVVEELLDRNKKPEAIICANDLMAYAVYRVLKKREIPIGNPRLIPGAIAVTGYDDDTRSASSDPPITTVQQDFYYMGYTAVEKLLALIRDGMVDSGIVPTVIQKRASCGCSSGQQHRYIPMSETDRSNPEFYAIKVAELMREEILISNVKEEIGDRVYDILYEAIYKDVRMFSGLIQETLNADVVIGQLRELVDSEYRDHISLHSLVMAFSDYVSSLINATDNQRAMAVLSNILVEGMKYLQNCILNVSVVEATRHQTEALQLSLIARNMDLAADSDEQAMYRVALSKMDFSDKSDIYIFVNDVPVSYKEGLNVFATSGLKLAASKTAAEGIITYPAGKRPSVGNDEMLLKYASRFGQNKSNRYCIVDVYHADRLYGVLVSRMDTDDVMYLTLLALQIAMMLSKRNSGK